MNDLVIAFQIESKTAWIKPTTKSMIPNVAEPIIPAIFTTTETQSVFKITSISWPTICETYSPNDFPNEFQSILEIHSKILDVILGS